MSIKNIVLTALPNITTYDTNGNVTGLTVIGNVTSNNAVANNVIANNAIANAYTPGDGQHITFQIGGSNVGYLGTTTVGIGLNSGTTSQGNYAVAVGHNAAPSSQGVGAVAIGSGAGGSSQSPEAVAVGDGAGGTNQGTAAVAMGQSAGASNQGNFAVAIGHGAGVTSQSVSAIAIGSGAGNTSQGTGAIAIGDNAGGTNQGANSIAIGHNAGVSGLPASAIVINGTGTEFNPGNAGLYISGLRPTSALSNSIATVNGVRTLYYDIYGTTTREITTYNTNMWAGVFAPFNGGTFSQVMLGGVVQMAGDCTLPTGIMPCTKYNIYVQGGTADSPRTLTAPSGGFIYCGTVQYSSIKLYSGETLEVTSRGAGNAEWDVSGGTAGLRLQGQTNNGVTTNYRSCAKAGSGSGLICYLDNFAVQLASDGRVNIRMTDGSTNVGWGCQGYTVGYQGVNNTAGGSIWSGGTGVGTGFTELCNTGGILLTTGYIAPSYDYSYVVTAYQASNGNGKGYRISVLGGTTRATSITLECITN